MCRVSCRGRAAGLWQISRTTGLSPRQSTRYSVPSLASSCFSSMCLLVSARSSPIVCSSRAASSVHWPGCCSRREGRCVLPDWASHSLQGADCFMLMHLLGLSSCPQDSGVNRSHLGLGLGCKFSACRRLCSCNCQKVSAQGDRGL